MRGDGNGRGTSGKVVGCKLTCAVEESWKFMGCITFIAQSKLVVAHRLGCINDLVHLALVRRPKFAGPTHTPVRIHAQCSGDMEDGSIPLLSAVATMENRTMHC
jgi:hypothetical protein